MTWIDASSWQALPGRAEKYGVLTAHSIEGRDGTYLAVDHEGCRHLLIGVESVDDEVRDERSRGLRAISRVLSVQDHPERPFIDIASTAPGGHEAFNVVSNAILDRIDEGAAAEEAVQTTLSRWRRFWAAAPAEGLRPEEVRGLFGELWFLATWLLPHGAQQARHWLGPTGTRHDFQWRRVAIEAKTTGSVRGHIHRINGIDQLDAPADGELHLFSLRVREESTASNTVVSLVDHITRELEGAGDDLVDMFEARLRQAGYSPLHAERYTEQRFRIVNERLYRVGEGFPRLNAASFVGGLSPAIERVEYEINLDGMSEFLLNSASDQFEPPMETGGPIG